MEPETSIPESQSRRLAAILAADIAGYSALMGADEARTVRDLKAHQTVVLPLVNDFGGRIIDTAGDGILAEFSSVVNAVRCAVTIQSKMAERNAAIEPERRMQFRIGINIGDVVYDEARIYGDGVNVAARLESIAEPGGICISSKVYEEINGRIDVACQDMGEQQLKNIVRPVRVYRLLPDNLPTRPTLTLPDKPSIAVLPFDNMSGDADQEYFADGISEDIITTLARYRYLFVIARNSSFTYKGKAVDVKQVGRELGVGYVLEGSVRKSGSRVRITAQLIDATSGRHVWAERYDRDLTDIFSLQDEITEHVVGSIEPELLKIESGRAATRESQNLNAWDLVCQGTWHFHQVTPAGHELARELFRKAIELNPKLPEPHIWLARVSAGIVAFGWSANRQEDLGEGLRAAHTAIQLDEKDPYSNYALAIISVFSGALEQANRAAEAAVNISPSFALGYFALGLGRFYSGNAVDAIRAIQRGLRLNPYDPQNFIWLQLLALAYLFTNQHEQALETALQASKIRPAWLPTLETLTVCYAKLNRMEDASECVRQMRGLRKPSGRLPLLKRHRPDWAECMAIALKECGWEKKKKFE